MVEYTGKTYGKRILLPTPPPSVSPRCSRNYKISPKKSGGAPIPSSGYVLALWRLSFLVRYIIQLSATNEHCTGSTEGLLRPYVCSKCSECFWNLDTCCARSTLDSGMSRSRLYVMDWNLPREYSPCESERACIFEGELQTISILFCFAPSGNTQPT